MTHTQDASCEAHPWHCQCWFRPRKKTYGPAHVPTRHASPALPPHTVHTTTAVVETVTCPPGHTGNRLTPGGGGGIQDTSKLLVQLLGTSPRPPTKPRATESSSPYHQTLQARVPPHSWGSAIEVHIRCSAVHCRRAIGALAILLLFAIVDLQGLSDLRCSTPNGAFRWALVCPSACL